MKARKTPKGWPTIEGRPATREEISAYIVKVEAHFTGPVVPTHPHFCNGCTAPLEFEPCPVCWVHRYKGQLTELGVLLDTVAFP